MQSSETWIIQSVPVHVSSSITPRHHFCWAHGEKNTQLLAQLPQLPRWPFRTALMQITSPDCLLRSLVSQTLRDEKDWMELSEIWQEFHLIFFVFGKTDAIGICISCIFVFVTTRGSGICAARPLQGARGCNWEARAEETEYSHCQLLPPSTSTSTSLHTHVSLRIFTHPLISLRCHLAHQLVSL